MDEQNHSPEREESANEFMGTSEAEKEWGYKQKTISKWCREGLILGAEQDEKEKPWRIPRDAPCPRTVKKNKKAEKENK